MKVQLLLLLGILAVFVACQDLKAFRDGNQKFTARLYKDVVKSGGGNVVISPVSVEVILALAHAGAKGKTADEISSALNLPQDKSQIEGAIKSIVESIEKEKANLNAANKIYVNQEVEIFEPFNKTASSVFKSAIENVNFKDNQSAANTINKWVEEKTGNKITKIMDPATLSADTMMVLVNALYFKGEWKNQFVPEFTKLSLFFPPNKTEPKYVNIMHQVATFNYFDDTAREVHYLEMPFIGDKLSMTIVLPYAYNGLPKVEGDIENVIKENRLKPTVVEVHLPKFEAEGHFDLKKFLQTLGINEAFSSNADFSYITKVILNISQVKQKACLSVNEKGAEVAAPALSEPELLKGPPPVQAHFNANHAFLYFIKKDGVVLFTGKVLK